MAGRFVRSSKYRHVFGRPTKKELCYDNLHISRNAWDSNIIKANPQYLSVNWESGGGGAFAVIPLEQRGRLPEIIPLFRGHTAAVLDTDWSPFNDSLIASGSDDGKVFVWTVPQNFSLLTEEGEEPTDVFPVSKLAGHTRKVGHVLWHPAAENVLASSSGDYTIKLWDVNTGAPNLSLKHADIVQSMSWSTNGSMLVTTSRDKKIRVWDPRQEKAAHEVPGHGGAKNSRAVWMTGVDGDRFATTGFSKMSDRQLGLWDLRTMTEGPVGDFQMLDSISGVCMPFWDSGTQCLYLAGKGDGNIRYYEYSNDDFIYLSEYKSVDPQRGIAFLPKRGVAVHENEVMRAFKTVNDTYIEPISFIVPRRAETFQDDIYPPAPSGEPAQSSESWFGGKDVDVPLLNMSTLYNGEGEGPSTVPKTTGNPGAFAPASTTTSAPAPKPAAAPKPDPEPVKAAPPKETPVSASPVKESKPAEPEREPSPKLTPSTGKITDRYPQGGAAAPAAEVRAASPVKASPVPAATPRQPSPPLEVLVEKAVVAAVEKAGPLSPRGSVADTSEIQSQLEKITALLESQSTKIDTQSAKIESQNAQIASLTKELDTLKGRVEEGAGAKEDSSRKDEVIRKLELELEEAKSQITTEEVKE